MLNESFKNIIFNYEQKKKNHFRSGLDKKTVVMILQCREH